MPGDLVLFIAACVFAVAGIAFVVVAEIQERKYHQTIWLEEAKRMHRMGLPEDNVLYNGNFIKANSKTRAEFEEWKTKWDQFGQQ